jgi:hypothetical protein
MDIIDVRADWNALLQLVGFREENEHLFIKGVASTNEWTVSSKSLT